jgi:hypothetical protein
MVNSINNYKELMITIINFYEGDVSRDGINTGEKVTKSLLLKELRTRFPKDSTDDTIWVETITMCGKIERWVFEDWKRLRSFNEKYAKLCTN